MPEKDIVEWFKKAFAQCDQEAAIPKTPLIVEPSAKAPVLERPFVPPETGFSAVKARKASPVRALMICVVIFSLASVLFVARQRLFAVVRRAVFGEDSGNDDESDASPTLRAPGIRKRAAKRVRFTEDQGAPEEAIFAPDASAEEGEKATLANEDPNLLPL